MDALIIDTEDQNEHFTHLLQKESFAGMRDVSSVLMAIDVLQKKKKKYDFIIFNTERLQDVVVPILKILEQDPAEFGQIPTLLVTSEYRQKTLHAFKSEFLRLDAYALKPFGSAGLRHAVFNAFRRRFNQRKTLALVSSKPERFFERLAKPRSLFQAEHHWDVTAINNEKGLQDLLDQSASDIGVLLLDLDHWPDMDPRSVRAWVRRQGIFGPVVAAVGKTVQPQKAFFGDLHFFTETLGHKKDIQGFVNCLKVKMDSRCEVSWRMKRANLLLCQNDFHQAKKELTRVMSVDHYHVRARVMLADLLMEEKKTGQALEAYKETLKMNPYCPHAYLKLMELLERYKSKLPSLIKDAKAYCPNHRRVLAKALTLINS